MNFLRQRSRSRRNSTSMMVTAEKWRSNRKKSPINLESSNPTDSDDDEEPEHNEITDWVKDFFERKSEVTDIIDQDIEVNLTKKQTLILSTLLPDEIIQMENFDTSEPKRFVGVLLMADVSGYTALSERYNNTGKSGTYRLTVTLNTYLGSLTEVIYNHGGDIIKFAGDAFLALWKTDKRTFLCHTIHKVIACALVIQHSFSSYETDVKVNLRVKLAISAGNIMFAPIGSGIDMNYLIVGLPVLEAKAAESICASGEVKLTPSAWGHCYSRNYVHVIDDKGYVTIKSILYDPHDSDVNKPFVGFGNMIKQIKKSYSPIENLPDFLWDLSKELNAADALKRSESVNLRKTILLAIERNIGCEIRKFMIKPVLTQIDAHQPLEFLTEMRNVTILFITLKPRDFMFTQLITIVNNAYQITCEIVYKSMGCVNKIILFDKDVMMLVIFGLRGFKHDSEAQAALKCAYNIKRSVSALDGVAETSIGVTTGPVYCGVVGHPLRREFTVIGAIVNKAARLMCGFKNKITCDETTFIKSKMSSNSFTLQPPIELKGIEKSGKIYEYSEEMRLKELYNIPIITPLLNHVDEIEYYESWLDDYDSKYRDFSALLVVGEARLGKSRTLQWMARCAKSKGFHVCSINLTSIHSATAYLALSQIINQILGLQEPILGFKKEEKIVQLLQVYSDELCYLNNIIKVRFAYHEGIHTMDENKRKEKAILVFRLLINSLTERYVILLDDLQNLDSFSWDFISEMLNSSQIFMVLSVTRSKFSSDNNWLYRVFINHQIRKICLSSLDSDLIPALACQILDVDGVANDLCKTLKTRCKGRPGLVESYIIHLFSSGALEIVTVPDSEIDCLKEEEDLTFPDPALLQPQALDAENQEILENLLKNDPKKDCNLCIVIDKEELRTNLNLQNLNALIMIQIDSLTPYQQLLLKIASVIGDIIPRDLLENIMYENNWLITAKSIKRLFALNLLSCANTDSISKWGYRDTGSIIPRSASGSNSNLICCCQFDYTPEDYENIPKYALCKLMRFRSINTRKTCYELLPMNQKKEFHTRIVNNLKNNEQKCTACGGKIMVIQPNPRLYDGDESSTRRTSSISTGTLNNKDNDTEKPLLSASNSVNKTLSYTELNTTRDSFYDKFVDNRPPTRVSSDLITSANTQYPSILKQNDKTSMDILTKINEPIKTVRLETSQLLLEEHSTEDIEDLKIFDMLREIIEAYDVKDWHHLGVFDSQDDLRSTTKDYYKRSFRVTIRKGVSETNFTYCSCAELNLNIHEQLIHHAKQADLKFQALEFLIKYCYLSVLHNDVDNLLPKLIEAEEMCSALHRQISLFDEKRFLGKIYSLKAATCLISGRLTSARLEIDRALKIYHIQTDKISTYLRLKNMFQYLNTLQLKKRYYRKIMMADSIFCLNTATLIYSSIGDERLSRMTALLAINNLQVVDCSVMDICDTYSNAMQVELERGMPDLSIGIEEMAIQTLRELAKPIAADELFALGKLFTASFQSRIAAGLLAGSIRSGLRALTISRFVRAEDVALEIIPNLFYVLLARRRISEAIDLLHFALRSNGYQCISNECETWYYALCLDMILDAGFELESPRAISRYAEYALSRGKSAGNGRRRLVIGLWTYWLRADSDKKAKYFETEALNWVSHEDGDLSMINLLSSMRLAEGMLESLARKVDDLRKVVDLMELRSIADRELVRLEFDVRLLRVLLPRWLLLKANSSKLSGRHQIANGYINQAIDQAKKMDNRLEENLARATISNSSDWLKHARSGSFDYWREGAELASTTWHNLMYKIGTSK